MRSIRKSLILLLLFSFSGALVTFIYKTAVLGGVLEEWQYLGNPGGDEKAVKIVDVGYVETQSGDMYQYSCLGCPEGEWERVDLIIQDEERIVLPPSDKCGTLPFLPILPSDVVDSEDVCVVWGHGVAKEVFAIDSHGSVQYWRSNVGELQGTEIGVFTILGFIVGFGIGLVTITSKKFFGL